MPYGKTPHLRRSATGRVAKIAAISLLLVTAGCDTLGARFKAREGADAYHAGDFNAASMKFEQALKLDSDHPTLLLIAIVLAFVVVALLRYFNRRGIVKIQKKVEAREHAAELAEEQPQPTADSEIR